MELARFRPLFLYTLLYTYTKDQKRESPYTIFERGAAPVARGESQAHHESGIPLSASFGVGDAIIHHEKAIYKGPFTIFSPFPLISLPANTSSQHACNHAGLDIILPQCKLLSDFIRLTRAVTYHTQIFYRDRLRLTQLITRDQRRASFYLNG